MIEASLRAKLTAAAGVIALAPAARIYPNKLDQGTAFPAITIQMISDLRESTLRGPSGLPGTLIQVDSWAQTYTEAKDLARQVRLALDGKQWTLAGETVQSCKLVDRTEFHEPDTKLHRESQDYRLWWNES